MSHASRCVPRCSDDTSSRWPSTLIVPTPSLQQLDRRELRRERRAELVRDVREHRVARAAGRLELRLVAQHLHLHTVGGRRRARDDDAARAVGAERRDLLERAARAAAARLDDRARVLARPAAVSVERRLQHVAAESARGLVRPRSSAAARPADSRTGCAAPRRRHRRLRRYRRARLSPRARCGADRP